jgi:hypothetical protein
MTTTQNHIKSFETIKQEINSDLIKSNEAFIDQEEVKKQVWSMLREYVTSMHFASISKQVRDKLTYVMKKNDGKLVTTNFIVTLTENFGDNLKDIYKSFYKNRPSDWDKVNLLLTKEFIQLVLHDLNEGSDENEFHIDEPLMTQHIIYNYEAGGGQATRAYSLTDRYLEHEAITDWQSHEDAPKHSEVDRVYYSFLVYYK